MNSRFNKLGGVVLSAVLILAGLSSGHAQTTNKVYWDFSNAAGPSIPNSGTFSGLTTTFSIGNASYGYNSSVASSGYVNAAGFAASGDTNAYVNKAQTGALDLANSAYFSFSLSLSSSAPNVYDVTDISFGSRQSGTGPLKISLYESTDNISFSQIGLTLNVNTNSSWASEDFAGISVSLPNDDSTAYFRIYGSDGVGTAGNTNWRIDDLAVTMVSVPEPSTVALAMLGGAACLFVFRRKR